MVPDSNAGGATWTRARLVGSAALDAGNDAACPATGQGGITRHQGAHREIGAYEAKLQIFLTEVLRN